MSISKERWERENQLALPSDARLSMRAVAINNTLCPAFFLRKPRTYCASNGSQESTWSQLQVVSGHVWYPHPLPVREKRHRSKQVFYKLHRCRFSKACNAGKVGFLSRGKSFSISKIFLVLVLMRGPTFYPALSTLVYIKLHSPSLRVWSNCCRKLWWLRWIVTLMVRDTHVREITV